MSTARSDGAVLSANVRDDWDTGAVVDFILSASAPVGNWRVELDAGGTIVNIWNAVIVSRSGNRYVLSAEDYNRTVEPGQSVSFGYEVDGSGPLVLDGLEVDPEIEVAEGDITPPVPYPAATEGGSLTRDPADAYVPLPPSPAAPLDPSAPRYPATTYRLADEAARPGDGPTITVTPTTVREPAGTGAGLPGQPFARGPLFTSGSQIIDSTGMPVELRGINWFGLETEIFAPHGLWARNWRAMMDEMKSLGFNTLRVPFSGELISSDGGVPSGIDTGLNPDLAGLDGLEILDAIVNYADTIGLKIILDYHRGPVGGGPNDNGLWFGNGRTEADVIREWQIVAERYHDKPAVIGADLVNEPYGGTWGDGSATDWAAAAERIGAAVQAIAPNWLIIVEGISTYEDDTYWWGGNLQGVRDRPVELPIPGKLVYSPHDYPASVHPQEWFFDGTDLEDKFRENWGYIVEDGIAPVLIGEWGSRLDTADDQRWADALSNYMDRNGVSWLWWSLNPNSGDTGGLYEDDWTSLRSPVVSLLDPFLSEERPQIALTDTSAVDSLAGFDVTLNQPSDADVTLKYATTDGTAAAGRDYKATAGALTIPQGGQSAKVSVPVLPDAEAEGDEYFYLVLGQNGAMQASGTAVIEDEDAGDPGARRTAAALSAVPLIDVASTVVAEGAQVAQFRIVLSQPASSDISIDYTARAQTVAGTATDTAQGTITIPAGDSEAMLEVPVSGDAVPEGTERFTLELTAAEGANIRQGAATALIPAEASASAQFEVGGGPTAATQATIDVIVEEDWGSGALFNVTITNESDAPISTWELSMDLPFDLSELWSAVLVEDAGERVTVQNAQWNGTIAPGETIDFGFISDVGGIALGSLLNGADLELAVQ